MNMRPLREKVLAGGAIDWDRRLFDSLIPLPDGTSYNAYCVFGSEKTALIDTVDPARAGVLMDQLADVKTLDYVVAHHAEQDHSGSIPLVLAKYPAARLLTSPKGKGLIIDHLHLAENRIQTVADGETVSLGNYTLRFVHTPWVHWPETMVTYLAEERILFTCDFFGSHLATTDLYARDEARVYEAAKRYYAEIMMPFRHTIRNNIEKLKGLSVDIIAPSHGPCYNRPAFIMDAYRDWISDTPRNQAVVPYVSMHGSTRLMVDYLVGSLAAKGITVFQFDLADTDLGKLAISLVDAATLVAGTPTVHVGPHPGGRDKERLATRATFGIRPSTRPSENYMVEFIFPTITHEDSRFYTLGHGGFLKRTGYALSRAVVTRTNSGSETFNISEVFGAGASSGLSNLYYPSASRSVGESAYCTRSDCDADRACRCCLERGSNSWLRFLIYLSLPHPRGQPSSTLQLCSGRACDPAILMTGNALFGKGLATAGRIAAATNAKLLAPYPVTRLERGSGVVQVERVQYVLEQAVDQLKEFRQLLLVARVLCPVASFAFLVLLLQWMAALLKRSRGPDAARSHPHPQPQARISHHGLCGMRKQR